MKKNKPKYKKEYLYAGIAVFFWSTVASAFKLGLRTLDHLQFLFYASITSTIILFLVILIQKKTDLLLQQSIREILRSAIAGLLNPFLILFNPL